MADHQADTKTQMNDLPCHMPPHSLQTHDANREPPKSDISAHSLKLEMLTENLPNQKRSAHSLQSHDADREPPKPEEVSSFSSTS